MRLLFEMDAKNYNPNGTQFIRPSVRAIIRQQGKIAMVHSLKYDYYKFPGGGMELGESRIDSLIRETREEAGMTVIRDSVQEYGCVHRVEKGYPEDMLIQDNFYYLCEAEPELQTQILDDYEAEEKFTLEFVAPETAIDVNRTHNHGRKNQNMLEREARVLEYLMQEGLL